MKAKYLFLLTLLCFTQTSCQNKEKSPSYNKGDEIRVTFHLNGGNLKIENKNITSDVSIMIDEDYFYNNRFIPKKDNSQFTNWYINEELTQPLELSSYEVTGNIDLYARWTDDYFNYKISEEGVHIGLNDKGISKTSIDIPSFIDGYKVIGIMDYGFSNSKAKKLYIPYYVENVGFASFYESDLEYIELGSNIKNIEHGAFIGTNKIKELKIEKNSKYLVHNMTLFEKIGDNNLCELHSLFDPNDLDITRRYYSDNISISSIAPYAFYGRINAHSIQLPYGITSIGDHAFENSGLIKFYMNDCLLEIGDYAFSNSFLNEALLYSPLEYIGDYCFQNTMITSINIPASIKYLGRGSLQAGVLSEIKVNRNDYYFLDSNENVLQYLGDGNYALVHFNYSVNTRDYHFDEKITKINEGAFYSLGEIDTVYFTNVKEIEKFIFLNLEPSQNIVFESDLDKVSEYAFYEEKRNLCFLFNAYVYEDSPWKGYFDTLEDYVNINLIV